jgi:FkbM family methyltransferase
MRPKSKASPPMRARLLRALRAGRVFRGWNRMLQAALPLERGDPYEFEVDFFGTRYHGNLGQHIDREVYFTGAYEPEELMFAAELLRAMPGAVVLDVGANTGHHALFFTSVCASVHAFEPNPALHRTFADRMAAAQRSNVQLHGVGLWNRDDILEFQLPDVRNFGLGTFFASEIGADGSPGVVKLPVARGDDMIEKIGFHWVDLVKVDVQGAEYEVLDGLQATLRRCRPVLWLEISQGTRRRIPTLADLQRLLGYEVGDVLHLRRTSSFFALRRPRPVDEAAYEGFDGNLFVLPRERPARQAHAPAPANSSRIGAKRRRNAE